MGSEERRAEELFNKMGLVRLKGGAGDTGWTSIVRGSWGGRNGLVGWWWTAGYG